MRSTISRLGLLATLALPAFALAPLAQAQTTTPGAGTAQPSPQGTLGTPTAPGGGGSSLAQGTPGMTNPSATTPAPMPGTAPTPMTGATATPGTATPPSTGGAAAPGTSNPPTTATPVSGANSFTEGQARSRIEAAGFTDVTGLAKDDAGVWRGRGMRGGSSVEVGLDFQGNVVLGNAPAR